LEKAEHPANTFVLYYLVVWLLIVSIFQHCVIQYYSTCGNHYLNVMCSSCWE